MRWLALLFCSTLFAAEPLNFLKSDLLKAAPTETAFPRVDLMTGTYIEEAVDLIVAGNDPLSIRRFYYHTAPTHDTRYGFWHFNPESQITANLEYGHLPRFASIGQFSGGMVQCHNVGHCAYGLTKNTGAGYRGQVHPLNTHLSYTKVGDRDNDERFQWKGTVTDGTGSIRSFLTGMHHWHKDNVHIFLNKKRIRASFNPGAWIPYQLQVQKERRPNGNVIIYSYCDWRNGDRYPWPQLLKKITLYNASETKELASLTFDYQKYSWKYEVSYEFKMKDHTLRDDYVEYRDDVSSFTITGSDGRRAFYQNSGRSREYHPVVLRSVQTPTGSTLLNYQDYALTDLEKDDSPFRTEYDTKGRVSAQYSPAGLIATYTYHPNRTDVTDAEGHVTSYFFDTRINRIENELVIQENTWDPQTGNLLCETISDKQGQLALKKVYSYDKNHNPILEQIGDYTIHRTFSDDGFNLKLSESDCEGTDLAPCLGPNLTRRSCF